MKTRAIKSIARFAVVLMVLSIIPSGAFAAGNGTAASDTTSADGTNGMGFAKMMHWEFWDEGLDGMHGMGLGPVGDVTEENFADVKAQILEEIENRITELQSFSTSVSGTTTAEELQEVLSTQRQAKGGRGADGIHGMGLGPVMDVTEVTDENFADVQTEMLDSLQNMIERLEEMQASLTEAGEDDRAEEFGTRISELQDFSDAVSGATNAEELNDVIFSHKQANIIASLEERIESLQAEITENGDTDGELSSRVAELTDLKSQVEDASSLEDLQEIMSSSQQETVGIGSREGPIRHGGRCGPMDCPVRVQGDGTEV